MDIKAQVPLVSIALCTYNGEKYLREQLDCLCNQTYTNLEIIVVDDCSTDHTLEILQQVAANDPRITVHSNEKNVGYNRNFEKACSLARAEYIAISDQDDIWRLDKIEVLMKLWTSDDVVMVHSSYASFFTGKEINYNHQRLRQPFTGNDVRQFFLTNHICGHNLIFKKRILELAIPFPKNIYYDWWLAAVACCNGTINATTETLTYHRLHESNVSGNLERGKRFYEFAAINTETLIGTPNISSEQKVFGQTLLHKLSTLKGKAFSMDVFWFILKESKIIFATKERVFPFASHVGGAFRMARGKMNA